VKSYTGAALCDLLNIHWCTLLLVSRGAPVYCLADVHRCIDETLRGLELRPFQTIPPSPCHHGAMGLLIAYRSETGCIFLYIYKSTDTLIEYLEQKKFKVQHPKVACIWHASGSSARHLSTSSTNSAHNKSGWI